MINKLLIIVLVIASLCSAQSKKEYDITEKKFNKSSTIAADNKMLSNNKLEMTLVSGGYFTIGTSNGDQSTKIDDKCQLTFGHPYAMTSYPVFSVDGNWTKADEYAGSIMKNGDTLRYTSVKENIVSFEFSMILQPEGVKLRTKLKNLDNQVHNFGAGLFIDPALGKWGDGSLYVNNRHIKRDTLINLTAQDEMMLWEKSVGARGIGIQLRSDEFLKTFANNWRESTKNQAPELIQSDLKMLYDLVLRMYFQDEELMAGQEKTDEIELLLLLPDFSSSAFTRWDIPLYLDITDNLMFPRQFDTYAEISNQKLSTLQCDLNVQFTDNLTAGKSDYQFSIPGTSGYFNKMGLQSKLTFEDNVVTATITIKSNNTVIDILEKQVFIPATPVSDTGLVIVNDSLDTSLFPVVDLFFGVENGTTGQRILNLNKENIYLYENGNKINNYDIARYGSGGSALADVVFVLDVSGSMGDNIAQVRSYLNEFADSLVARGYDYQIGVVTFSTTVDAIWDLTKDLEYLKTKLGQIVLWGGVEDSPSALMTASKLSFRPGSKRTIIWITDESYPENNYTKLEVVDQMLLQDITVHGIGEDFLHTDWFNPILIPTAGNFYNIHGNFRDILLDVTRTEAQDMYYVSYHSSLQPGTQKELKLKIYFGGYGVIKSYNFNSEQTNQSSTAHLKYYPNPFNPEITFLVNTGNYVKGEIRIFSILGECVKTFQINNPVQPHFTWNARNEMGLPVSTGFYIVQLMMTDVNEQIYQESAKILYLK